MVALPTGFGFDLPRANKLPQLSARSLLSSTSKYLSNPLTPISLPALVLSPLQEYLQSIRSDLLHSHLIDLPT